MYFKFIEQLQTTAIISRESKEESGKSVTPVSQLLVKG